MGNTVFPDHSPAARKGPSLIQTIHPEISKLSVFRDVVSQPMGGDRSHGATSSTQQRFHGVCGFPWVVENPFFVLIMNSKRDIRKHAILETHSKRSL